MEQINRILYSQHLKFWVDKNEQSEGVYMEVHDRDKRVFNDHKTSKVKSIRKIICIPIYLYQLLIRPIMKPCCRYYPTCSDYALTAIKDHGVLIGIKMTCCRVLRCHPWSVGGYDPVLPILPKELPNKENY